MRLISPLLAVSSLLVACSSTPPPSAEPSPTTTSAPVAAETAEPKTDPPETATTPDTWSDDLSQADKGAFMKAHVMPKMGAVFKSMSAERYADFSCGTCHGPEWKTPKDFLPKLTMKDGKFTAMKDKAAVVEFMMTKVTPEMAQIFGKPAYDPKTNTGFGCGGCHVVEM